MPAPLDPDSQAPPITLVGPLTRASAPTVCADLLARLRPDLPMVVDLAGVSDVDTCGLQVLLAARKWSSARGQRLTFTSCSPVAELCNAFGIVLECEE